MSDRLEALRRRDIRHSPDDPAYAVEALRQAWRRGDIGDAESWLGRLAPDDRAAWLTDVRSRLDLGEWLSGLDRTTALRWLHRLVPWHEVWVVAGDTSRHRGAGVPLVEAVQWVCADHTIQLTEPCHLPWPLAWSVRAAQLWACDRAERAIGHAAGSLHRWEAVHPTDDRPRRAIEAARRAVEATRGGDADYAAYAADAASASAYAADAAAAAAAYAAYAAARASDARAAYAADYAAYAAAAAARAAAARASAASLGRRRHEAWQQALATEREWQAARLWDYLCGVAAPPAPAQARPPRTNPSDDLLDSLGLAMRARRGH